MNRVVNNAWHVGNCTARFPFMEFSIFGRCFLRSLVEGDRRALGNEFKRKNKKVLLRKLEEFVSYSGEAKY